MPLHDLVYGEHRIPRSAPVPHRDVVEFVRSRPLYGRETRWIDIHLLASPLIDRSLLRTADPRLAALTQKFGILSHPPPR